MSRRRSFSLIMLGIFYIFLALLIGPAHALAVFISCSLWSLVFRGHLHLFSFMSKQLEALGKWISTSSQEFVRR